MTSSETWNVTWKNQVLTPVMLPILTWNETSVESSIKKLGDYWSWHSWIWIIAPHYNWHRAFLILRIIDTFHTRWQHLLGPKIAKKWDFFCKKMDFFLNFLFRFYQFKIKLMSFLSNYVFMCNIIELRSIMTNMNDFEYQWCQASKMPNANDFEYQ